VLGRYNEATCQALTGVSGRLSAVIVWVLVDDDGFPNDICGSKTIGEKIHPSVSIIGEKNGKVSRVIAVRLVGGIPVLAGRLKRIGGIADGAGTLVVDMEAKRPDRLMTV